MSIKKSFFKMLAVCLIMSLLIISFSTATYAYTYKTNQDSTAYVWTGKKTASGLWPEVGYCAVHPTVNGGTTPKISFGTIIYIDEITNQYPPYEVWDILYHPDYGEISTLQVQDIGDKYYTRGVSTYWLDIYWGDDSSSAADYGERYIDYHY